MPPRDTAPARRDAEKKRGVLGPDANLGEAAVTRVRELLHRRGARGGSGSARVQQAGRGNSRAPAAFGARARAANEDELPVDAIGEPKGAAKNRASAHNARVLAAASAAADLATNSGKANARVFAKNARSRASAPSSDLLKHAAGTCGAAAAGTSASLDRAAVAAVAASANVAAVAAAAERGGAADARGDDVDDGRESSGVSSDENSDEVEWEDVGGDFGAYVAPEEEDDATATERDSSDGKGKNGKNAPRRVSPADRRILRGMHQTHLLCSVARAAATDAAASDPLVRALAVSAAPRGVAFADVPARAGKSPADFPAPPTADRVARVAEWFAGAFECRAVSVALGGASDGTTKTGKSRASTSRETPSSGNRRRPRLEPLSRFARVKVADDVVVLDADDAAAADDDDAPVRVVDADAKAPTKNANAQTENKSPASILLSSHLADARVAGSLAPPRLRLAFACARRRGTQEDLVGLFVAAARGLGHAARVVAALDPTPHRASASELEKLGVRVGGLADAAVSGASRKKRKRAEGSLPQTREGSAARAPSFLETSRASGNAAPAHTSEALARERVAWWAEVLCVDEPGTEPGTDGTDGADAARWVPVVPHAAGVSRREPRWSFRAGGALVDDARALSLSLGASPYVFAFGAPESYGLAPGRVVATDVTRKYAEAFSRCAEKRVDPAWVAETTRKMAPRECAVRPSRPSLRALVASADARDAREMEARARTERVPSTLNELKNHPLYACERFLRPNQVIFPRKPVVGFVNGECVFPRSRVSELRSAERWKSEARREVLPEELAKPRAWTHSRASRAAAAFAARRAEAERAARRRAGEEDGAAGVADDARAKPRSKKRRRPGPRSVEEMARDAREAEAARLALVAEDKNASSKGTASQSVRGDIPLFGVWQTREWRPPRAADGIVPKNARGNVDLIGAHALPPPGTAHVSLPRIARVARALRDAEKADGAERPFDFAPALVGFEYRRGGATLPKFDGAVVCVEREACLRDAWRDFETARVAREREKDAARAKRRWRVLLSAVWTRRSLRDEFLETDEPARARDGGGEKGVLRRKSADETDSPPEKKKARGDLTGNAHARKSLAAVDVRLEGARSGRVAVVEGGAEAEVEAM